jgi:hypothetical protein
MNLLDKFFITEINLASRIRPQIKDLTLNTLTPHDGALFIACKEIRFQSGCHLLSVL